MPLLWTETSVDLRLATNKLWKSDDKLSAASLSACARRCRSAILALTADVFLQSLCCEDVHLTSDLCLNSCWRFCCSFSCSDSALLQRERKRKQVTALNIYCSHHVYFVNIGPAEGQVCFIFILPYTPVSGPWLYNSPCLLEKCELYSQAIVLVCKFHMCSAKISLSGIKYVTARCSGLVCVWRELHRNK